MSDKAFKLWSIVGGIIAAGLMVNLLPRWIPLSEAQKPLFFPVCFGISAVLFPLIIQGVGKIFRGRKC